MKRGFILLLLVMFFFILGCSKKEEEAQIDEEETDINEEEFVETKEPKKPKQTEPEFETVFPLTGIGTNEGSDNRSVGVMINNHAAARPQSGLSQADIVFEILAEGSITRFLALFQSEQPDIVGPVRSAREYYFELASGYDALYVYHGAAGFVNDMIINQGIEHLNGSIYDNDGRLFKRESFRKAPHNSYLLFNAVYDVATNKGYDIIRSTEELPFLNKDDSIHGNVADFVEITYPGRSAEDTVAFSYDPQTKKYTRFERQVKTVELNSEIPIQVDNVFIVEAPHQVIDSEGRRAIDLLSGGPAYLFQKGKVQQLEWINKDGRIIPVKGGQPVGLVPGKTWLNVVPSNPGIERAITVSNN